MGRKQAPMTPEQRKPRKKPYSSAQAVSVTDVAKKLDCHPQTIYNAIERGEIRVIRLGRIIRIPIAEVERIMSAQQSA